MYSTLSRGCVALLLQLLLLVLLPPREANADEVICAQVTTNTRVNCRRPRHFIHSYLETLVGSGSDVCTDSPKPNYCSSVDICFFYVDAAAQQCWLEKGCSFSQANAADLTACSGTKWGIKLRCASYPGSLPTCGTRRAGCRSWSFLSSSFDVHGTPSESQPTAWAPAGDFNAANDFDPPHFYYGASPSPVPANNAFITNGKVQNTDHAPVMVIDARGKGTTAADCKGTGLILQVPHTRNAHSFSFGFHFYAPSIPSVQSQASLSGARIGVTFHYVSSAAYYAAVWGKGSAPCANVFKTSGDQRTSLKEIGGTEAQSTFVSSTPWTIDEWYYMRVDVTNKIVSGEKTVEVRMRLANESNNWALANVFSSAVRDSVSLLNAAEVYDYGSIGIFVTSAYVEVQDVGVVHHDTEAYREVCDEESGKCTAACGDRFCDAAFYEDCANCPDDCTAPCGCGDRACENSDEVLSCPEDCGMRYVGKGCDPDTGECGDTPWKTYATQYGANHEQQGGACPVWFVESGTVSSLSPGDPGFIDAGKVVFGATSMYFNFENEAAPLEDRSGHRMNLAFVDGTNATSRRISSCGNKLGSGTPRIGHCLQTEDNSGRTKALVLDDPLAAMGVLPIDTCPFTVTFWAKVDAATGGQNRVIGWGSQTIEQDVYNRFEVLVHREGVANERLVVKHGWWKITVTVAEANGGAYLPWNDNGWHHIFISFDPNVAQPTFFFVIDGVNYNVLVNDFLACDDFARAQIPVLTFENFTVGEFNGGLDELWVIAHSFDEPIGSVQPEIANYWLFDVRQGFEPSPPPTPWPTPYPPGVPTPGLTDPDTLPPGVNLCPFLQTCEDCFQYGDGACHWCPDDHVCRETIEGCVIGELVEICAAASLRTSSLSLLLIIAFYIVFLAF